MSEWYETFFSGLYDEVLAHQFDEARTLKEARTIKRVLKLCKGARILDIPCGMGRLTLPLARMGFEMTGVDLMARYVRHARRAARKAGLAIRFQQGDMREIAFDGEFDAVLNWFTSFGYFSKQGNLAFLKNAFKALKPGGRLLIETQNSSSRVLAHPRTRGEQVIGGIKVIQRIKYDGRSGRMMGVWTLSKGTRIETRRISVKLFNGKEMRAILRRAGFRDITLYGRSPLGRFTHHSWRMIAVARRPK